MTEKMRVTFNFDNEETPLGKYKCRYTGCPYQNYSLKYLQEIHEQKPHTLCSCGNHYQHINKHFANMKRKGDTAQHVAVEPVQGQED